ncbi:hypothetical protein PR048_024425 [Dryococelus australis]|uniref:Uncharacterized protein n=1 Tax=Dryococelus australis TaxID=614101 RepID=A0ABQ9GNN3_9NEOP|nr:hypothetical protein PR048_024425 [Dryococelus australis]
MRDCRRAGVEDKMEQRQNPSRSNGKRQRSSRYPRDRYVFSRFRSRQTTITLDGEAIIATFVREKTSVVGGAVWDNGAKVRPRTGVTSGGWRRHESAAADMYPGGRRWRRGGGGVAGTHLRRSGEWIECRLGDQRSRYERTMHTEDPGSIPGPAILISALHGFPKSLQANTGMGSNKGHGRFLPQFPFLIHGTNWDRGDQAVSSLASHQGYQGSIPGRVTGFSHVGIVRLRPVGAATLHKCDTSHLQHGRSRIFACGKRAGRCRWLTGFLGDLPFPPPLHSGSAPYSPRFILNGSQDFAVKCRPNLSTQLATHISNLFMATTLLVMMAASVVPSQTASLGRRLQSRLHSRLTRGDPIAWPSRSPDITQPDVWLWGHITLMVYTTPLDTRDELH